MKRVVILGSGMVGEAIAIDLCRQYRVTAVDIKSENLERLRESYPVETIVEDLSNSKTIKKITADFDLVIGALPGFMGFESLKSVIENGKNVVDISFFNEDPFELDSIAKRKGVTAIVDCGVAPGMSNMILGYHNQHMRVERFECLVGGLPFKRTWPYEYKAPFSPIDVLEEYTRPARIVENSQIVTRPALSDPEYVDLEPVGTLEAFNTDGLRTLLKTMNIPYMKEKTLRYPGHITIMKILRETGFFSKDHINIAGKEIRPIDLTTRLLFPLWKLEKDEQEFTVMRITISGKKDSEEIFYEYNMFDRFDDKNKISSMARTTGFTCTAVVNLLLNGNFKKEGISPPEYIGADPVCFNYVIGYLKERNINYILQT